MTQHELLAFVSGLHDHIAASISNPGPWCWPTRELLIENLNLNRHLWGPRLITGEFPDALATLLRKHWMVAGPCEPHCHATHIRVTEAGLEALRLMDEQGCRSHIHVKRREKCHREGFHFRRKIAA
jgi:hypothetical protein